MNVIYIIEKEKDAAALLERSLAEREVSGCFVVSEMPEENIKEGATIFDIAAKMQKPYRLGDLLDRISGLRANAGRPQIMRFENCTLDTVYCLFSHKDGEEIRLTEKETEILAHLAAHSLEVPVRRDDLLSAVWGYGDNIETHTLETHIYRLRQKIEDNPSTPEFLVTNDDGYTFPAK